MKWLKVFFCFLVSRILLKLSKYLFLQETSIKDLLSKDAKFSEKLTFLTHSYANECVRIKGKEMLVFRKILRTYLRNESKVSNILPEDDFDQHIPLHECEAIYQKKCTIFTYKTYYLI